MTRTLLIGTALFLAGSLAAAGAQAAETLNLPGSSSASNAVPGRLAPSDRLAYRDVFAAMDAKQWADAKAKISALQDDNLRYYALAEFYLAKDSPRVELFDLMDILNKASWLPQAEQLQRLAQKRGAQSLPDLPQVQKLVWMGSAPRREYTASVRTDAAAQALGAQIQPYIKNDDPAGAEALLAPAEGTLSPEGLTEMRARVAWSYYIENDDANARRLAATALQSGVDGDWTVQANWTAGLAAWRQNDYRTAAPYFAQVAGKGNNADMRAAGAYWAARAYMNSGEPQRVESLLRIAAQTGDTFYGMLSRETLGMPTNENAAPDGFSDADWSQLRSSPNVKVAMALADIGQIALADETLRYQAKVGGQAQYQSLLHLAAALDLPATELWLAHNGPAGVQPAKYARFPAPNWTPDGGWRVDPALIFAHTLQESGFRTDAVSSAGARGLMQVRPGTAGDVASGTVTLAQLSTPSTNMEYGQRYLEQLSTMSATGGLLPKVMAAYNAGPVPVERWNTEVRDGGDPLLFMESLPYYETRAYVNIVMRNYWVYQMKEGRNSDALMGMAQGKWPRFPRATSRQPVRLSSSGFTAGAD